ncbi:hypothetical protein FRX31_031731 [Thalictrum thalictroides]|uniref:Uncharacterized protein n=1 Tax=Thalictrum thalictroides TaxID=46969 RepID=A0A7J6V2P6_THATH|nr:hypothetical protein FRX31_031731 [Thalictrum thalictroides]
MIDEEEIIANDKSIEELAVNAKVVQTQGIAKFIEGVFLEAESLPQDLESEGLTSPEKVKSAEDGCKTLREGQETEEAKPAQVTSLAMGRARAIFFEGLVNKVRRRIDGWKNKLLSQGGLSQSSISTSKDGGSLG